MQLQERWSEKQGAERGGLWPLLMQLQQGDQTLPLVLNAPSPWLHKATVPPGRWCWLNGTCPGHQYYIHATVETKCPSQTAGGVDVYMHKCWVVTFCAVVAETCNGAAKIRNYKIAVVSLNSIGLLQLVLFSHQNKMNLKVYLENLGEIVCAHKKPNWCNWDNHGSKTDTDHSGYIWHRALLFCGAVQLLLILICSLFEAHILNGKQKKYIKKEMNKCV